MHDPRMAIVVTHKEEGGRFVLLGASFTKWKSVRASLMFGMLGPVEKDGDARVLSICGADGVIRFVNGVDYVVVAVDGKSPADVLSGA